MIQGAWMRDFLTSLAKIIFYASRISLRMFWRHRALVSYGIIMFMLGIWVAGGFDSSGRVAKQVAFEPKETAGEEILAVLSGKRKIPQRKEDSGKSRLYSVDLVVGKGDTFLNMLVEAGVEWNEAYAVSKSLKGVFNLRSLRLGQGMEVFFKEETDGEHVFNALKIEKSDSVVEVARKEDGTFNAFEKEKILIGKQVRAGGTIRSSLFKLTEELGVPVNIVMEAIRAYSYDVDFQRDIHGGNDFEVLYEVFYDEKGNKVRYGDLKYAKLVIGDKAMKIYQYTTKTGDEGYYTGDGRTIRRALLKTPINGARISSRYGLRRHPVQKYTKMHKGVDFAAPRGTPIYAAGNGTIEKAGRFGSYGKYIKIRHNGTYSTSYAHMQKLAKGMKRGRKVKQGQVIGYVGTTGRSTGPHLHYETLINGRQKNPLKLKMTPGKKLSKKEMARFETKKLEVDTLLASLPLKTQIASTK
jgi:murein DD-endopeptidase MepM/ murein hydrolase activator NlpD